MLQICQRYYIVTVTGDATFDDEKIDKTQLRLQSNILNFIPFPILLRADDELVIKTN